ncbi:MAG: alpha/beta fold hydrolase [Planctomycetes bacterium]|nr:alpha/beta fold hydrolase [Planctomycetota bacterium]
MIRRILQPTLNGGRLVGTGHLPEPGEVAGASDRLAVVLVNFAQASRAGVGDLSVWIGDQLAAHGYPVFRFDLPGLGDSLGPAPEPGQPLWCHIREGKHAETTTALLDHLRAEFPVERFVVGGLCAGAVTALYAAARRSEVAGVILLEPVFHLCDVRFGSGPSHRPPPPPDRAARRWLQSVKRRLRKRLAGTPVERRVRILYASFKRLADRARGRRCPPDAIRELLATWQALVRQRLKILIINSGTDGREMYNRYYLGGRFARQATWRVVRESNHMLAAHGGKEAVSHLIREWLDQTVAHDADTT